MLGCTLIHEIDPARLGVIPHDPDAIDDFDHVDLDGMVTSDFLMACPKGVRWTAPGEPLHFDEDAGLVILAIDPAGLAWVLGHRDVFAEDQQEDLDRLAAFVAAHGRDHLYAVDSF